MPTLTKPLFRPTGKKVTSTMLCVPDPYNGAAPPTPKYLFVVSRGLDQSEPDLSVKFEIVSRDNRVVESDTVESLGKALDYCDAFAAKHGLEKRNFE